MITNLMKISAIITFLICVLLTGICHSYQLIGTAALSEELIAQHYTINPRLDAVIVVDRTTPTFEYQTFYCAGSADEEEGVQGRIHFLEHLMAGTGSHGPGKLNEIIVDNGGQNYAATTIHHMYLRMRFPKDKFDLAVEIDRDRYYGTLINEEVVENEKKIVLTEKSRNSANSNKKFSNRFWGLVHKKENFSGVGTEDFIKQLEPDDLKVYYENFLSHQKRLIVVVGDVDMDHVLTKLDEAYGNEQIPDESSSESPSPQFPNPEIFGKKVKDTSKSLRIAKFWKSWQTPHLGHRDYATLLILARILTKASDSLRSSVIDAKLARIFRVSFNHYKGFSLLSCWADLPTDTSIDAIETAIQTELEEIRARGVSEDEFTAAQNLQLKSMYSRFYDRSGMANEFGRAFAHTNDPLLYPKMIKDLKSARRDDIPRLIDQYLVNGNSITLSLTLPPKEKTPLQTLLYYAFIFWILAGFVSLVVWAIRRRSSPERLYSNE
ncbi:MAG: insulinase family protein [Gemmatimonadetes bacterium]|nr:insulinase family protein [Gemmatimonadota bacterium]